MAVDKGALEALRIERRAESDRPSGGRRWLAAGLALVVVAGLVGWWLGRPAVAEVRTAAARAVAAETAGTVLNASGYVTARRQATVSSKVTGKVVEVLIEEGMRVDEGQLLAQLDDSNVRARLRLAEAGLAAAETALKETEALLAEARLNLERTERLDAEGVASPAALDRARAEAHSLAARLERQREEVTVAERQVALGRQDLDDLLIRAPFAGVVVAKNAQPGEMISPTSAGGGFTRTGIGTIVDMESLEIEVDVNEAYINRVEPAQRVVAVLDAYPDWRIPSRVIAIIPTADRQRATVTVRVGFDLEAADPRILPDMGVKVAFQEAGEEAAAPAGVAVPRGAVRRDDDRDVVLVVAEGVLERRAVALGGELNGDVVVAAGLKSGERVVIEGPAELAEGDRVEERER